MEVNEIDLLKTRLAYLEDALASQAQGLVQAYKLTPKMGELLALLLTREHVTANMILGINVAANAKVAVHRLRTQTKDWKLKIHSKRYVGYWLDEATKEQIRQHIAPRPAPTAAMPADLELALAGA